MSSTQMFVIGKNEYGGLGLNQSDTLYVLTPLPEKIISKAFSGREYSIYTDGNYDNLWSAGYNDHDSCCVGF